MTRHSYPGSAEAASQILTNAFRGANSFANFPIDLLFGQLKFPAIANPSSDPNTFDDYERGTFTPNDASGAGLAFSFAAGSYIKSADAVLFSFQVVYPATASGANALVGNLPFVVGAVNSAAAIGFYNGALAASVAVVNSTANLQPITNPGGAAITNAQMTGVNILAAGWYQV